MAMTPLLACVMVTVPASKLISAITAYAGDPQRPGLAGLGLAALRLAALRLA